MHQSSSSPVTMAPGNISAVRDCGYDASVGNVEAGRVIVFRLTHPATGPLNLIRVISGEGEIMAKKKSKSKSKTKSKPKHDRAYLCKKILALLDEFGVEQFHDALAEMMDVKKEHGGELPTATPQRGS